MKRALLLFGFLISETHGQDARATSYTVTAYCHCARCCGRAGQPTASGRLPVVGVTVAGPRNVPLGTRVYIAGVGVRTVQDRLARRYDNRFDVFLPNHHAAQRFGRRTLTVRIIK